MALWLAASVATAATPEKSRTVTPFDNGWEFLQGDPAGAVRRHRLSQQPGARGQAAGHPAAGSGRR